ncbi:MAG TPA: hypothetical protein VGX48_15030 [Pyrinomonadaceae bacterium]|nr:hypothetical protein [Pyrinomonadaceae bacterium]
MGLHDKHGPRAARPAAARPEPKRPAAPPAYRPQPTPKVLQRKEAVPPRRPPVSQAAPSAPPPAPPARRPPQQPRAWQPKPAAPPPLPPVAARPAAVQRKTGPVVQAIKLYPNLHPGAVERVEPGSLFRLENFTDQYRLRREQGHGAYVPNQQYNFVRTAEGQTLLHNRYRHPSIAEGRQVLYAGEAHFNNGRLEWWSNGSGHYQPDSEDAGQAGLPMDNFYTYQQVIKGEHKRKRTGPPSRK